MHITYTLCTR